MIYSTTLCHPLHAALFFLSDSSPLPMVLCLQIDVTSMICTWSLFFSLHTYYTLHLSNEAFVVI